MPMLKTAASGTTSIANVRRYLEKGQRQEHGQHAEELRLYEGGSTQLSGIQVGTLRQYLGESGRALAVDVSEDLSKGSWAQQMDLTRARFRHDRATGGRRPRTYFHFILSPAMEDECDLATMRAYARAWAEENFRQDSRLCEYAIVCHDDNAKGVLHAHIIVNATNKATGRKLHLSNDEVVALEISAQDIGRRFGLTPVREQMQSTIGARTTQPVYLTRKERKVLSKGGYSWKWELRKVITGLAPLCNDFEDFKSRLNRAGYDVERSEKTGHLTYTHKNGSKVKDSRLGSRFYIESLERLFNHEHVLSDQTYSSWELIKISKGEIPWKEDIRRAIDAIAPTVMSVPELQRELDERYGIRLTVNRRGITYQHACGFKVRDIGIGLRYTLEGLRQNAVVDTALPYPRFQEIEQSSQFVTRHYMPRSNRGISQDASETAATLSVFHDIGNLMARYDLARLDDIPEALEERHKHLRSAKAELSKMRSDVMRWNHLSVLQSRYEKDRDFLVNTHDPADVELYNETLLRCRRLALYLKEQTGDVDPKSTREEIASAYQQRLEAYQGQMSQLERDAAVYRNYLIGRSVRLPDSFDDQKAGGIGVERLVAASKTLSAYRIRDFFHLEQTISERETRLDLARFRWQKADGRKRELESIRNAIQSFEDAKTLLPNAEALQRKPVSLGLESQKSRFEEASRRLEEAGVKEADFAVWKENYRGALRNAESLRKECEDQQSAIAELKAARDVCNSVAEMVASPVGRELKQSEKASSGSGESMLAQSEIAAMKRVGEEISHGARRSATVDSLPLDEARRRREERLRQSPERSKRFIDDVIR